jgi:glycosyltransferase involved in cell wall biosynthesis
MSNEKVLIICEARPPQVNGVVTTFRNVQRELEEMGYTVDIIGPDWEQFKTMSLPFYKEIQIVLNPWKIRNLINSGYYDFIHIATEGPLGYYAAKYCEKKKIKFTTSYHTKMPEYVNAKFPLIPTNLVYRYMRRLHKRSSNILVTSESMRNELIAKGFNNSFIVWARGVDETVFNSSTKQKLAKPYLLYVGRVSVEKNIDAFMKLDFPDHIKVIVGDGPDLARLKSENEHRQDILFVGVKFGKDLAAWYAGADCFVFPSKTDTYGIVMIESLCCGTPVAGYDVTGPVDIITRPEFGEAYPHLQTAVEIVLDEFKHDPDRRQQCEDLSRQMFTWYNCASIFAKSLVAKS